MSSLSQNVLTLGCRLQNGPHKDICSSTHTLRQIPEFHRSLSEWITSRKPMGMNVK